jgi:DNA-binding transcriptional LysR family regulator
MEHYSALRLFISIADAGNFSAAGESLGISTSAASRQIAALEAELGVRLLKRSTRRVELTDTGSIYLQRVRSLLADLEETNRALKHPNSSTGGRFRIAAPTALGLSLIAPAIADFMAEQPQVTIEFDLLDRVIDLLEEDYDLALRIEDAAESGPHSQILALIEVGLFCSPSYLARHGRPHGPADLAAHRALTLAGQENWNLRGGPNEKPKVQFSSNRLEVLKALCLAGQGIALFPHFLVRGDVERNELMQLLDGFEPKPSRLIVVRAPQRSASAAPRLFENFLAARFKRMRF